MSYPTSARPLPAPPVSVSRPPVVYLYVASASVLLSALLLVPVSAGASALGYLLAPFIATGGISFYRAIDIRRQASVWYVGSPGQRQAATLILTAGFVVGAVHAWILATEIAKAFSS